MPLREEMERLFDRPDGAARFAAYSFPRCTFYCGRWIRHGDWYPDRQTRLWQRGRARWGGIDPHDKLLVDGPVGKLRGDLHHFSNDSINGHIQKIIPFSEEFVRQHSTSGRRTGRVRSDRAARLAVLARLSFPARFSRRAGRAITSPGSTPFPPSPVTSSCGSQTAEASYAMKPVRSLALRVTPFPPPGYLGRVRAAVSRPPPRPDAVGLAEDGCAAEWFGRTDSAADRFRALTLGPLGEWKPAFHSLRPLHRVRNDPAGIRGGNLGWRLGRGVNRFGIGRQPPREDRRRFHHRVVPRAASQLAAHRWRHGRPMRQAGPRFAAARPSGLGGGAGGARVFQNHPRPRRLLFTQRRRKGRSNCVSYSRWPGLSAAKKFKLSMAITGATSGRRYWPRGFPVADPRLC